MHHPGDVSEQVVSSNGFNISPLTWLIILIATGIAAIIIYHLIKSRKRKKF